MKVTPKTINKAIPTIILPHYVIKVYGGMEVELHAFLTSRADRSGWSCYCTEGGLGPTDNINVMNHCPCRKPNPVHPSRSRTLF
jgi:hypothetical protein